MDAAHAAATAESILAEGGQASAAQIDMRRRASVQQVVAGLPVVDILVCTPSINVRKPMLALSDDEFARIVDLNLHGTFIVLQETGRRMASQGRGSIIVFSSIRAQVIEPGQSVYAATKAGVVQLVRTLAAELGPQGVRANAIAPGPIIPPVDYDEAKIARTADKTLLNKWADPQDIVRTVIFIVENNYLTGELIHVDGGQRFAHRKYEEG